MPRKKNTALAVVDTTAEDIKRPEPETEVRHLSDPDLVPCESCGTPTPAAVDRCRACGRTFNYEVAGKRQDVAHKQKRAAEERAAAKPTPASGEPVRTVAGAWALIEGDAIQVRDDAAREVQASQDRLEKSHAALFANECQENRADFTKCQLQVMATPANLKLAENALKDVRALKSLAEHSDQLRAAGGTPDDFRAELAKRMAKARAHLDAAVAEMVEAFNALAAHQQAARAATDEMCKLGEKLLTIKSTFVLRKKLPHGHGQIVVGHDEVTRAAAKVILDALKDSSLERSYVDAIRVDVKWQ